ncbi:thiamine ABC transporter substrate-binding protein [Nocardioides sp.]|uniref:thiamine ABC transporter substrate-binding protein n=1 Tax=Nocardioides sp. TaxID=35761 RepID=UPI0039E6A2BC
MRKRAFIPILALGLGACSLAGGSDDGDQAEQVVLVTHESFALPDELVAEFEDESGYTLKVQAAGDAGTLANKLVLTKDDPTGDVAFGVDNTFASRALTEGVFADYTPAEVPAGVAGYDLPGDDGSHLTPVDNGNVCVNIDTTWFASHGLPAPTTLDDLTKPAYQDLLVTPGATTSSPGMAFLLATIATYGDGWPDYWKALLANGAEITDGWSDAYEVDFTQGGGSGNRPIVVSYDSSPAFTVTDDGSSTTKALLDTCFTQVEYAGVLAGAENPDGAKAFVDFLLSPEVQAALPEAMYVFPVVDGTSLPEDWAAHAPRPTAPLTVAPEQIDAHRDEWLRTWSDLVSQ